MACFNDDCAVWKLSVFSLRRTYLHGLSLNTSCKLISRMGLQGTGENGTVGQDPAAAAAAAIAAVQARQEEEDQSATAACKEQALQRAETIR